jgi:hypothetical protein
MPIGDMPLPPGAGAIPLDIGLPMGIIPLPFVEGAEAMPLPLGAGAIPFPLPVVLVGVHEFLSCR